MPGEVVVALYGPDGSPFVHFSNELDPEDMTFRRNEDGSLYETRLQVDIEVRDRAGGTVARRRSVR